MHRHPLPRRTQRPSTSENTVCDMYVCVRVFMLICEVPVRRISRSSLALTSQEPEDCVLHMRAVWGRRRGPRSSEGPRRPRIRLSCQMRRHRDRHRSSLRPRHLPPSKGPSTAVGWSRGAWNIRRFEGLREAGGAVRGCDWGWKGAVSLNVERPPDIFEMP